MVMDPIIPDEVIGMACNTQIEKALLRAWLAHYTSEVIASTTRTSSAKLCLKFCTTSYTDRIFTQFRIQRYHSDFMFIRSRNGRCTPHVLVECDGHDYHERTKTQAEHDRRRDRHLQALGYPVLRFTGSELWRSPSTCAEEIEHFLQQWLGRRNA
jgi:very-short-patch-repair endonuclease